MFCPKNSARPARSLRATARRRLPDKSSTWIPVIKSWGCDPSLIRAFHLKPVTRGAIPVRRRHASDEKKFIGMDPFFLRIEQHIPQMQAFYQTNHHAIFANL